MGVRGSTVESHEISHEITEISILAVRPELGYSIASCFFRVAMFCVCVTHYESPMGFEPITFPTPG